MAGPLRLGRADDGSIDPLQGGGHEQHDHGPACDLQDLPCGVAQACGVEGSGQGDEGPHHHRRDHESEEAQADSEDASLDPIVGTPSAVGDPYCDDQRVEGVRDQPQQAEDADDQTRRHSAGRDRRDTPELSDDEGGCLGREGVGKRLELPGDIVGFCHEAVQGDDGHYRRHERDGEVEGDAAGGQKGVVARHVPNEGGDQGEQSWTFRAPVGLHRPLARWNISVSLPHSGCSSALRASGTMGGWETRGSSIR